MTTRREFITLLGSAAVWPLAARAQERLRRIGMLVLLGETDPLGQARSSVFRQGLQKLGWIEGSNLSIDYHWLINDADRARTAAQRVAAIVPSFDSYDWKYGLEENLIAFLHACWEREQHRISGDPALQGAFLSLLACLVSRGGQPPHFAKIARGSGSS